MVSGAANSSLNATRSWQVSHLIAHEVGECHALWPVSFADFVCRCCKQKRAGAQVNTSPDPVGRTIKRSVSVEAFCFCALEGTADFFFCLFSAHPVRTFDALAGLEVLVDLEEVLDFQAVEL